ncbi:MAG: GTP 3',8-cyclase MoaA, partial [candidate division Zixibacteria bacterium]|nr:GTP 3',8-cyclase MoaA [candidate division Zixibacteria bacterium]
INYLRLSVTDRCNLRCFYCVPEEKFCLKKREEILSLEELERVARVAINLGINKIRLTGGEPLLRKGITLLIQKLAAIPGLKDLSLTSNGTLLKGYAQKLKECGLKRINLSLDTLQKKKFKRITGKDLWEEVMEGLEEALFYFQGVKLNVVALKGTNEDEILDFVEFIQDKPVTLRFVEFMPIGENGWSWEQFLPSSFIKDQIQTRYELKKAIPDLRNGSEELYQIDGFRGNLGFISAISHNFCQDCNRLRLTADGFLKPCLFSELEIELKSEIRQGAKDERISELFKRALTLKPEEHRLFQEKSTKRRMFQIGG